jgi:hypothetical protein
MFVVSVLVPGRRDPAAPLPPARVQPPAGQSHLTRSQALASASRGAADPVAATLMDYRSAAAALGEGPDPGVGPATLVWVVTVSSPEEYTVILNGSNGTVIDSCIGCVPR